LKNWNFTLRSLHHDIIEEKTWAKQPKELHEQEAKKVVEKKSGGTLIRNNELYWDINNIEMDKFFNSAHIVSLIAKWKYHLITIIGVSAVLAIIFSGPAFITPMYKSYGVAYPANIEPYSEESETEQMLQILNSKSIVDSMIIKFNLPKHYGINPDYIYYKTLLVNTYYDNVRISKTPYESVRIEVMDKNPDTASLMVESIFHFYDEKIASLHKSKYKEVIDMYGEQLARKRATLDSLKSILYTLGTEQGIIEYEYQSQEIMRGYLRTVDNNSGSGINTKEVDRLMKNMGKASGQLIEVVQMIQDEARTYVEVKLDYEMAIRFYESTMTYSNIVTYPYPSDKKSYPVRWLVVVIGSLATFIFALLLIFLVEGKRMNKQEQS
ncbi:MAG: hypothetical protein WC341_02890, partial [Bacteroidales bacterium]